MNRRVALNILSRSAVLTWLASWWGNYQAKSTVPESLGENNNTGNSNKTTSDLDASHRARRKAFESRQISSTAQVAIPAAAVFAAATTIRSNADRVNIQYQVDSAFSTVPQEERPDTLKDLGLVNGYHNRRVFLAQAGTGTLIGGVLGPLVTWFFNPGQKIAEHVHGPEKEGEPEVVTLHRETTRARQNTASTALNFAFIGGIFASPSVLPDDKTLLKAKCITIGKYRLGQLFQSKQEVGFIVDNVIMSGENLLTLLPNCLQKEGISLEVKIERKGQKETLFIDYIDEKHLVRGLHGEHSEENIILQNEDKVTIKAFEVGWNGNGKAVQKTNGN